MKIEKIINALKNNQIVAIPTDTVYGMFAFPSKENAKKINALKHSPTSKKLSIMSTSLEKYDDIIAWEKFEKNIVEENLPGPKTFILPLKNNDYTKSIFPWEESIGIRVPDFFNKNTYFLREVLKEFDFLFATSVNISGEPTLSTAKEIKKIFGKEILIVKEIETLSGKASTIISLLDNKITIIRE